MTSGRNRVLAAAALSAITVLSATAVRAEGVNGIWLDQTGRGAVEVTNCGPNVCGRLVWVKDGKDAKGCGLQILGDVKPVAGGKYDNGWIYDPDEDQKYSVELTPIGADKLKVLGYAGSKFFSETMIWKRAPADLKRCDAPGTTASGSDASGNTVVSQATPPADTGAPVAPADNTVGKTAPPAPAGPRPQRGAGAPAERECKLEVASIQISFPCP
jgi:uncharacterized protein (DUF2147 family)